MKGWKMAYRLLDHTADLGVEVWARDPGALFAEAGLALFSLITDPRALRKRDARPLAVTGVDWTDLLVNWLRELLHLWNGDQLLVCGITVNRTAPTEIRAEAAVDRFDPKRHSIESEIKAVTYHQARVQSAAGKWSARFIVDI